MADAGNRDHLAWLRQVARDGGLTGFAVRVAVALTQYFNRATGEAHPGQETLAQDLGATADGVRKAIRQLEAGGHLSTRRGGGFKVVNHYRPTIKPQTAVRDRQRSTPARHSGKAAPLTPDSHLQNPRQPSEIPPTARPPNPLKQPLEEPLEAGSGALCLPIELPKAEKPKATKRAHPLPRDWEPPQDAYEYGERLGLTSQEVETATARFRNHAAANGRSQKDWAASWRNWLIGDAQRKAERLGQRQAHNPGGRTSAVDWMTRRMTE